MHESTTTTFQALDPGADREGHVMLFRTLGVILLLILSVAIGLVGDEAHPRSTAKVSGAPARSAQTGADDGQRYF